MSTAALRQQPLAGVCTVPARNAMSVDVEDYFQVSAFAPHIPREHWPVLTCRVESNVDNILGMFESTGVKATFFTLGWIAERYPHLVQRISDGGHEIASHGYGHERVSDLTPEAFLEDLRRSKGILEQLSGRPVSGYRAPSFSVGKATPWAAEMLHRAGYRYSSSVYPIQHDHYGTQDAPRFPFYPDKRSPVLELPITTVRLFERNLPAGGGGYFRLYPYFLSRWMIRRVNRHEQRAGIFYFHPWEIDPDQPRQCRIGLKTRFRHYINLERMQARLDALTRDFRWDRIDRIFLEQT